ncbi:hypothetical protein H310_09482 [Aphanomyces invadans]|uniref:DDE-1 domain-containing protein n=1 Tax=Aphanomyces invadans TaxID=157072 RepID=A0A024TW50_9STRA|nr:hypothetical protein H310_09482 [Aphanomyces invadans]ETV97582.1 hypothetical protein H310_09482 [Aphanomyces invadans]|eukprot:XP_008873791.1 hypothetical protein H310_09482 [Aphanomyces invadans]
MSKMTYELEVVKDAVLAFEHSKLFGLAVKYTSVPTSDEQAQYEFFIKQLLDQATRCQLDDEEHKLLLGLKLSADKTRPNLKTIRLQTILDEIDIPALQGVTIFQRGVRHPRVEACLENTDKELLSISDCMKLLRSRQIRLDNPPNFPRMVRSESASTTASAHSSSRTPPRSLNTHCRGSKVGFEDPSTLEKLLAAYLFVWSLRASLWMPRTNRKRRHLTVTKKLDVVKQHLRDGTSVYILAKKYGVQGNQVLRWVRDHEKLKAAVARSPGLSSAHTGRAVARSDVEAQVLDTMMLVLKARNIEPDFHGGKTKARTSWVYQFLRRNKLSIRRPTREGQKLSSTLATTRNDFVASVCESFLPFGTLEGLDWDHVVNMDERRGSKTVSVRTCSSNNPRITACLAVTVSGRKLPPFVVFKGVPGARIEAALPAILPDGVFATCQKAAWMDEKSTELWVKKVWKQFAQGSDSSLLILDDYKCHKQSKFTNMISDQGTELEIIPGD